MAKPLTLDTLTKGYEERFWLKCDKSDGCWIWKAKIDNHGFGVCNLRQRRLMAHRMAYLLVHKTLNPELLVLQSCNNRSCINPAHLSQGTAIDNCSRGRGHVSPKFQIGSVFGRWTVVADDVRIKGKVGIYYPCKCLCGVERLVLKASLNKGNYLSCGCISRERKTKHGLHKLPEYAIWTSMKQRCFNPNNAYYSDYGGRGITVCDGWITSFPSFISDMGYRPSSDYSLDRIDPDQGYFPDNCRWILKRDQPKTSRRYYENRKPCKICGEDRTKRTKGRCVRCYEYWFTHKKERPLFSGNLHFINIPAPCSVCGVTGTKKIKGKCSKCYNYFQYAKVDRPPYLFSNTK